MKILVCMKQVPQKDAPLKLNESEKLVAMGTLAAGLAHEMRNPANAIVNALPPFKEQIPPELLSPETGTAHWFYQVDPHDLFDHDSVNELVLLDTEIDGRTRQVRFRWKPDVSRGGDGEESPIYLGTITRVEQCPPVRVEKPPQRRMEPSLPRITRLMALAVRFEGLLRDRTVKDYSELAHLGGVSRARITQIMNLRNLAPALQEHILLLPPGTMAENQIDEHALRRLSGWMDWRRQMKIFAKLWPVDNRPEQNQNALLGSNGNRK